MFWMAMMRLSWKKLPQVGLVGTDTAFHRHQMNHDVRPGILAHANNSLLLPWAILPAAPNENLAYPVSLGEFLIYNGIKKIGIAGDYDIITRLLPLPLFKSQT